MFQLDNTFLEELGLGGMAEDEKQPFLAHIYQQLEQTVGTRLSDGLSDAKMDEFGMIMDRKPEDIQSWLQQYAPDFMNDELFQRMMAGMQMAPNDPTLHAEYAATKWLEINRPDYRDVVAGALDEIKQEIIQNRDVILGTQSA